MDNKLNVQFHTYVDKRIYISLLTEKILLTDHKVAKHRHKIVRSFLPDKVLPDKLLIDI